MVHHVGEPSSVSRCNICGGIIFGLLGEAKNESDLWCKGHSSTPLSKEPTGKEEVRKIAEKTFNKRKANGQTEFVEPVDYIVGFVDGYEAGFIAGAKSEREEIARLNGLIKAAHYKGWYNGMVDGYTHDFSWDEFSKDNKL